MTTREDMLLGLVAVHGGLMTVDHLKDCVKKQRQIEGKGRILSMTEIAVQERILTSFQAKSIMTRLLSRPVKCHECGERHHVIEMQGGSKFRCKKCRTLLTVPIESGNIEEHAQELARTLFGVRKELPKVIQEMMHNIFEPGHLIGGCKIIERIGQGGMGEVYRARQLALDRDVAVKVLSFHMTTRPDYVDRFEREARAAAQLKHANIVQVYDVGEDGGIFYLIMELVQGKTIYGLLKAKEHISWRVVHEIAMRVAEALECAHGFQIVHRDIKPDNIMISRDHKVKIMDMGLAKMLDAQNEDYTRTSEVLGTPYYMSPEQCRNDPALDCRSDLFSLGATLFHMLTGHPPFEGTSPVDVLMKVVNRPTPDYASLNVDVPREFYAIIEKLMEKDADKRFQTPTDLLAAMKEVERKINAARVAIPSPVMSPPPPVARSRKEKPKSKLILAALIGGGVLIGIIVGLFLAWMILGS